MMQGADIKGIVGFVNRPGIGTNKHGVRGFDGTGIVDLVIFLA
jgi:hypothetical protein